MLTQSTSCRCGVCEALAKHAYRQVKAMQDYRPGKKVHRHGLSNSL